MKKLARILLAMILIFSISVPFVEKSAEAAKAKVYPVYFLENIDGKFSKKLTNGLTVKIENKYGMNTPLILKGNKKVWTAELASSYGFFQYTVTTNKDTFLYCTDIAGGGARTQIIGVHSNGKVFLKKLYVGGAGMDTKFLSSNKIEVAIERVKKNWNPSIHTNAERFTDIWDVKVYSISKTGEMKLVKKYVEKNRDISY
ncbi:hypothetical protein [Peribacillus asahii]|uniref:hypothetical protein n=1 Tax=Peribacillus asahii TaxID=228899 RepID=UPI00382F048A